MPGFITVAKMYAVAHRSGGKPVARLGDMTASRSEQLALPSAPPLRVPTEPWRRIQLSLRVWWRAAQLDQQLAAGASPRASAEIGLRAQRITRRGSRKRLADGLARALRSAQETGPGFTAAVRPDSREMLAARIVVAALDQRLRAREPVTARGVAMLQLLLTECTSPLYRPSQPGALGSCLRAAAAALEPADRYD